MRYQTALRPDSSDCSPPFLTNPTPFPHPASRPERPHQPRRRRCQPSCFRFQLAMTFVPYPPPILLALLLRPSESGETGRSVPQRMARSGEPFSLHPSERRKPWPQTLRSVPERTALLPATGHRLPAVVMLSS